MGSTAQSGLAAGLFSPVLQRLVGLLFAQADRRFQGSELIRLVGSGTGAVVRQLDRLVKSGLVTVSNDRGRKLYQANEASPIFAELKGIAIKTTGLAAPLQAALEPFAHSIDSAFVYGSIASGTDRAGSDIDLMVISDTLTYADIFTAVHPVEQELGRTINPTVISRQDWQRRQRTSDAFASRVSGAPRIMLIGSEGEPV